MARDRTDSEAISASIADPESFGLVFERHFDRIFGYAARRLGEDKAGDVAAEAFTVAFRRRADFDTTQESALPWLYGITVRLISRRRLAEFRRLRALRKDPSLPDTTAADADSRVDASRALPRVAKALGTLSRNDRETLLLIAWGGLTYQEVSVAMDVPVGTVRSRLNRARKRLRSALPELAPERGLAHIPTEEGHHG